MSIRPQKELERSRALHSGPLAALEPWRWRRLRLRSWSVAAAAVLLASWAAVVWGEALLKALGVGDPGWIKAFAFWAVLPPPASTGAPPIQALFGHALLHSSPFHLALNLYALLLIGSGLEQDRAASPVWLTLLFAAGAAAGGLAHFFAAPLLAEAPRFHSLPDAPLLGASGAICALLGYDLGRRALLLSAAPPQQRGIGPGAFLACTVFAFAAVNVAAMWILPQVSAPAHFGGLLAGLTLARIGRA